MYGLIWRVLPGPWVSKFILSLGLLAGAAALLWFYAFPELSPHMPFNDGAVDTTGIGAEAPASGDAESGAEGAPEEPAEADEGS
ncbi:MULTISPECIES: hypothetical protein [unclassified Nocardiopsis]|uniref:hypothetical protein n=1 Tax=unclassified Nocardiopsis TaxID=2649073 RepID=UPI0033E9053A